MHHLFLLAAELGLTIIWGSGVHLAGYRAGDLTIRVQDGLPERLTRSLLGHEIAHHMLGHRHTENRAAHARQERSATEWAARELIALDAYRESERLREGHLDGIAHDLNVSRELVTAYQSMLLRTDQHVYLDPHLGARQWANRARVA